MLAAVYARKSTEQKGADAEAKSVARQIDNARAFARAKGWRVADTHVYSDDKISGAETTRLVNRQRLIDTINGGAPFQALILRDASRFSRRDGDEAFGELKRIAQAGVQIWFYSDGQSFTYGDMGSNVIGFVRAEMNAEFRRQIAKWTREAHVRKAEAGHVTGGRVFGYDLVDIIGGRQVRRAPDQKKRHPEATHVERMINQEQAAVVRRIFALCASGTGYTRIAKQLNAAHALCPRPQQARPTGWSPSSVYEVLHRELYCGRIVWAKTRKRDVEGKVAPTARPESEWLRIDRPELRIIDEAVWEAVHERLGTARVAYERQTHGRRTYRRDEDSSICWSASAAARCVVGACTFARVARTAGARPSMRARRTTSKDRKSARMWINGRWGNSTAKCSPGLKRSCSRGQGASTSRP
jgi:DNA invertase Pin-like site-specific DNA recombinase